jgi:ribosomal protein L3
MGGESTTVGGLEVILVDKEKKILAIKGAAPGNNGNWMEITGE